MRTNTAIKRFLLQDSKYLYLVGTLHILRAMKEIKIPLHKDTINPTASLINLAANLIPNTSFHRFSPSKAATYKHRCAYTVAELMDNLSNDLHLLTTKHPEMKEWSESLERVLEHINYLIDYLTYQFKGDLAPKSPVALKRYSLAIKKRNPPRNSSGLFTSTK